MSGKKRQEGVEDKKEMGRSFSELGAGGGWVAFRPEIKVLDCTIRDGGLINDHLFEDETVRRVYKACVDAGIDYVELGYRASKKIFSPDKFGKWKFCDDDEVRRVLGDDIGGNIKLSVMADVGRTDYKEDFPPKEKSVFDCIRVACYIHQIPAAMDMIKDAHDKGYETMLQLMAVSAVHEHQLRDALDIVAGSPVSAVYIVDSWGALYSEEVRELTKLYLKALKGTNIQVGFHGHNNQQLAFANTIEAIIYGANRVDATMNGIGRGAGNCPMELLLSFLHNPKFKLLPVLECIRDVIFPLREKNEWGYIVHYALTGIKNQHPEVAIEWRKRKEDRDDIVAFYKLLIDQDM